MKSIEEEKQFEILKRNAIKAELDKQVEERKRKKEQ